MRFLHISDLHYHRDSTDNQDADRLLETIGGRYPEHYLVVTGDITDDGHDKQCENAFTALEPFKGRLLIAPGNHDYGYLGNFFEQERAERFDNRLSIPLEQRGYFSGYNNPVINDENGVRFIALDSNLETMSPFDFACGEIGSQQLTELDKILNRSKEINVLFFHHHPFGRDDPFMELRDAKELARIIYGRIDVLLFGHKHETGYWQDLWGIPHILASDNSPGKSRVAEITIEGSNISVDYVEV